MSITPGVIGSFSRSQVSTNPTAAKLCAYACLPCHGLVAMVSELTELMCEFKGRRSKHWAQSSVATVCYAV